MTEFTLYRVGEAVWVLALAFALYAGWVDWRTRRIPNWLTVTGFATGIAVNSILGGWRGTLASLAGAGLALGILLPLVLLRGFGAGDWKLMGAVGALLGWRPMLFVLLAGIVTSGLMGVIQMIVTKRVKATLLNVFMLARGLATFGLLASPVDISLDNPTLTKVPFGVAACLATVLAFALTRCVR
jgi:prepilin peptidase CpaA